MNEEINAFPSKTLYGGKLVAAGSVAKRRLVDLEGVEETENTSQAVVFVDTQGGEFPESTPDGDESRLLGESKRNEGEAMIVKAMVKDVINAGVLPSNIAVITPYNAQVSLPPGYSYNVGGISQGFIVKLSGDRDWQY
jgi:DNA polymerase alpha-associated DNA helicase A